MVQFNNALLNSIPASGVIIPGEDKMKEIKEVKIEMTEEFEKLLRGFNGLQTRTVSGFNSERTTGSFEEKATFAEMAKILQVVGYHLASPEDMILWVESNSQGIGPCGVWSFVDGWRLGAAKTKEGIIRLWAEEIPPGGGGYPCEGCQFLVR